MPLFEMSANIQEQDAAARKRSHDDFLKNAADEPSSFQGVGKSERAGHSGASAYFSSNKRAARLIASSRATEENEPCGAENYNPGLTESGSSPIDRDSPSPNLTPTEPSDLHSKSPVTQSLSPSTSSALSLPPAKRKRLTAAEKTAKAETIASKKKERDEQKAKRDAQKAAEEAEKAIKREEKNRKKEEAKTAKAEKDAEKAKKERSQMKLTAMFGLHPSTPKKQSLTANPDALDEPSPRATPPTSTQDGSLYHKLFKPFFKKEHVTVATPHDDVDQETKEAKSRILDEYLEGKRVQAIATFNPLEHLELPFRTKRGRAYPSVRKIMTEYHGDASDPIDLTKSQDSQTRHALEALKAVPLKSLKFREDVRPPYIGTMSALPAGSKSLQRLARRPTARDILSLDYEYDSEAEWQEEDGEDVDDLDEDEDEGDDDEDMVDFLDDSEDAGPSRLLYSGNGSADPESTGLCWENRKRLNSPAKLYKYRMEFVLGTFTTTIGY
jgi:chromatin assembly factor 1 subunit A